MILRNCSLLSELVEGYTHTSADILIEGGEIKGIYPCGELKTENNCEMDMNNQYVLPGLFDMHVHLTLSAEDTLIDSNKTPIQLALDGYKFALDSLKRGFTTLRDVGASNRAVIGIRDSINNNKLIGPNIFASGRIITPTESGNEFFKGMYLEVDKPDDMVGAVRNVIKDGADFIKLMGTGAIMNPGGVPGQTICFDEEYKAIVKAAEFKNTYVAVHCHGTEAIKSAIKAGCRTIEHASIMDDEAIEMLENSETYIVPTLSAVTTLLRDLPLSSKHMKAKAEAILNKTLEGVTKAYKKRLKIGFGTDQGVTGLYHGDNGKEFELRQQLTNMDNIDLIKQATINSAEIMGVDERLGSIKVGKIADLISVEGNPLKDISVLRNGVTNVIKTGVLVK
ncbi:MAG: amidohydrolase family protein [Firmicutes bacterium]|nr:amidohydrolase family protein [Bacillota bacterium]